MKLLVTVDTEEAWDWIGPYPTGALDVAHVARLPEFHARCERHGMRPTYFASHAVIADPAGRAVVSALAARPGTEVGLHVHPWNTPPLTGRCGEGAVPTFLHTLPDALVHAKLRHALAAFARAGIVPTSFRGGRFSSGGAIHAFLRANGFVADCSVVPFTTWREDGAPDFRRRDLGPVRLPPLAPGQRALWEIPLSLAFTRAPFRFWSAAFEAVERSWLRRLRLIGIAGRLGLVRRVWLNFEVGGIRDWLPLLRRLQRSGVPCATLTVHSSSLFAGPGPYTRTAADEAAIGKRIEEVFTAVRRLPGVEPATVSEAAAFLEDGHAGQGRR